ncbi:MAG TPA: pyridoxamine 5'-phosphate oxidase family protein [Nitrososphaerales archaeon]|nr:pyridoxamine 5'-phosphate oxidase family protein [Nitrososphaerales archaeon]
MCSFVRVITLGRAFKILPLTELEVSRLLAKPILGHLGVVTGGRPHVSPLWIYYQGGLFYFSTRSGRLKGAAIGRNPSVALSIATDTTPYMAVLAEGTAEIASDEWLIMGQIIDKYVTSLFGRASGEVLMRKWKSEQDRHAYVLRPRRVLSWDYGRGDLERQDAGTSMLTDIKQSPPSKPV